VVVAGFFSFLAKPFKSRSYETKNCPCRTYPFCRDRLHFIVQERKQNGSDPDFADGQACHL
jgi:hypothetical protein